MGYLVIKLLHCNKSPLNFEAPVIARREDAMNDLKGSSGISGEESCTTRKSNIGNPITPFRHQCMWHKIKARGDQLVDGRDVIKDRSDTTAIPERNVPYSDAKTA
uniref:Reverse transcriptase n=1 Tax=Angiostrongylus cantonensis TaxID=6313 RepID=A0A0K0DJX7_ANGCA